MNHYAYYALKNESGYAFSSAVENCSFVGGTKFSFGMDFYYNGAEGVLFSQKESVTCRIVNRQLEWKTANWCLSTSSFTMPLIEDGWNHIDVVYEERQVILYLNAVEAHRADINAEPVYSSQDYHYLEQDIGYVRNVRIVDHAMTQEEIIANLMQTVVAKEHLWLYIPFDVPFCQDQGMFQKVVHYGGLSRCENMIKVLHFGGSGYALLDGVKTNPGDAKMADFTIAIRIFSLPCSTAEAVLFENTGVEDLFQICLLDGQKRIELVFGTEKIALENSLLVPYEWTDLIVVKKGTKVQCFINGQMSGNVRLTNDYQRKNAPRIILGNKFKGYMDYIGIYGKSLSEGECLEVHQIEPYIFDEGLALLFLFHGEKEENFLGEGTLLLHKNVEVVLAEGTIYEEIIEPFNFRTKPEFSGNEFEKWQADLLADIVTQFSSQATGLGLSDLDDGTKEYLWSQIGMHPEAQELFLDFAVFTTAEIINLMSMAVLQELAFQAALSAMMKGAFSAFMMLNMDKIMAFQLGLGITIGIAFIVDVAVKTKEKVKEPEDPPVPPIWPEPEWGYAIELLSMQFCNGDTGSIPLRKDWQTMQSVPEWSSAMAEPGVCAYVNGVQTPKVKIRFRYLPAKDQPPVSVKIGARNQLLGECISNEVYCTVNQIYETEAVFQMNQLNETFMGKYKDNFSCFYQAEGSKRMLRTADMMIHVLCKVPKEPWSIKKSENAPLIPMLEYAAKITESSSKVTEGTGFIEAAASWLSKQTSYTLEAMPRYSRRTAAVTEFCCIKFLETLSKGTISAGELDYYMFITDLAAMEGIGLTTYEIFSMEKGIHNWKGELSAVTLGIDRKEDSMIFGKSCPQGVRNCCVISDVMEEKANYWDLLLKCKSSTENLRNLSWEEYCEQALAEYVYVYEPMPVASWKEVCELPKHQVSVIFDTDESLFVSDNRWDFKSHVKSWFSYPQNKACCHRISYHTTERILATTFNKLGNGEISKEQKDQILNLLLKSFYPSGRPGMLFPTEDKQNYDSLLRKINWLKTVTVQQLQEQKKCINVGKMLDQALNCLNSAFPNLRGGYVSWNSSIGENYDFSNWVCVIGGHEVISNKGISNPPIRTDKPDGIYLLDQMDGRNVHMLRIVEQILKDEFLDMQFGSYYKWENKKWVYFPIVYSTQNEFLLSNTCANMIVIPYYYQEPDTGEWKELWKR